MDAFLKQVGAGHHALILLPWYLYLDWKKVENHFGTLRLHGVTVAGYFADALLPFDLNTMPNYHRMILLDFFRTSENERVQLIQALSDEDSKTGFSGLVPKRVPVFHQEWYEHDRSGTHSIDSVLSLPLLQGRRWAERAASLRFVLTSLWSLCFQGKSKRKEFEPIGTLEMAEHEGRLTLKCSFEDRNLNLKSLLQWAWPPEGHRHPLLKILFEHTDFVRVLQFPEDHTLEFTLVFSADSPSLHHTGEVRGFWIEPHPCSAFRKSTAEEGFENRIPVWNAQERNLPDQFLVWVDQLRSLHDHLGTLPQEERYIVQHQIAQVRRILDALEKKLAEKGKVA
jgi:hypothetical protein